MSHSRRCANDSGTGDPAWPALAGPGWWLGSSANPIAIALPLSDLPTGPFSLPMLLPLPSARRIPGASLALARQVPRWGTPAVRVKLSEQARADCRCELDQGPAAARCRTVSDRANSLVLNRN
jgi:hypothetical protein